MPFINVALQEVEHSYSSALQKRYNFTLGWDVHYSESSILIIKTLVAMSGKLPAKRDIKTFASYKKDAPNQITMANGAYYPDVLISACELYKPVLIYFEQLLVSSASSESLLKPVG